MSITHVGPTKASFNNPGTGHSWSGRILSLAVSADGLRLYAGSYAGVWLSDDAGRSWSQLMKPQPLAHEEEVPGALYAGTVFDLVVSPVNRDLVLASGARGRFAQSRDGLYRSTDGGHNWTLVLPVSNDDFVSQIAFAPDDPTRVFAAIGSAVAVSQDAGLHWVKRPLPQVPTMPPAPGVAWHVAAAPLVAGSARRVYAAGSGFTYCSLDGGTTWILDAGVATVQAIVGGLAGGTADNSGSGASVIVVDPSNPNCVFMAAAGGANGPSYFAQRGDGTLIPDGTICNTTPDRGCGEGSLWYGDFTKFKTTHAAVWTQLPGPPVYWGTTTPSGNSFVVAKTTPSGFLLFFADESHVHMCVGKPAATSSWHRLDGKDASQNRLENDLHNRIFVHPDPHALVVSSDFNVTLKPAAGVDPPYNQNSVLDQHLGGTIWMANDGGVSISDDGGQTWQQPTGLETLDAINIAGVAGIGPAPALYIGCGDNDDFFTLDGGQNWGDPSSFCGDCDAWFADIAQPTRLLQFNPPSRGGKGIRVRTGSGYPDASTNAGARLLAAPRNNNVSSGFVERGYRPLIRTLATELPLPDGDYVFIGANTNGERILLRTAAISTITTEEDWDDPAKAQQIGPVLPPGVDIVQPSGGHASPVFYVADTTGGVLFKLDPSGTQWVKIVPGGPPNQMAQMAWRFFVSPFDPSLVYVLDSTAVKVSLDGGASWQIADSLTRAVTAGHRMTLDRATAFMDMVFVRSDPFTAFVFGHAGVSCTVDGVDWRLLLSAHAMPGCPEFGFFDGLSDPQNRALYVSVRGRSVLRIDPILRRITNQGGANFTLLELAAMLET